MIGNRLAIAALLIAAILGFRSVPPEHAQATVYDVLISNGTIIDGSGMSRFQGDLGIRGDRVIAVGDLSGAQARKRIDARGMVVAPGFIDMMGQSELSVLIDPRAQSKVFQGITTEVTGEGGSAAPISEYQIHEQRDFLNHFKLKIDWRTLDGYFKRLERNPPAINLATFVGTAQVRQYVMKDANRAPTRAELDKMRNLVKEAMEQGALGVTSALMYPPNSYAKTEELIALSKVASQYGGIYATHMRNEADTIKESLDEAMRIGREAKILVEVYHLKVAGKRNWGQMPKVLKKIEDARAGGLDITADQYPYTAAANGLGSCLPTWAAEGGLEKSLARLRNPKMRERIKQEIRNPKPGVDDVYVSAGGGRGILISGVLNPKLKKYEGKRLNEVAKLMGRKDELDAALDLILADRGNTGQVIFIMSEPDVQEAMRLPWIGVCCDADARALDGPLSEQSTHPRAFGTFPRILGRYVRDLKLLTLEQAIYKMTSRSAERVHLKDRGLLKPGYFADVVVFDPRKARDVATYENPKQLSIGMRYVLVNGKPVISEGKQTAARPGRPLRGPGYGHKAVNDFRTLFDGKTFEGWEGDIGKTWRVKDSALVGGSLNETVPHNAFLATTREYANFDLRLKFKLVGTGFVNGGVQFRSQRIKEPAYEMTGYQADMGEGYWGSLYDESRRNRTLAQPPAELIKRTLKPNDWNDYRILCEGRHIRLWLNGVQTVDYTETDEKIPMTGFIAVQIHGGGKAEASYRDIVIKELE